MAISLIDNLKIQNKKQNVERDSFATITDMVSYSPNYLPNIFHAMCEETGKMYVYNVNNDEDPDLGKWREFSGGSGGGTADVPIEKIKVNGELQTPVNKVVDITVPSIEGLTKDADLATVAKSGSYEDLSNKPTIPSLDGYAKTSEIPTKISELENDSNYLSSIPEEYVTDSELEAKGYLTEYQDISGKVDKVEGKSLISDTEIARLASVDNYDDTDIRAELANKADTTSIPSKVSELTNDSNYQTAEQVSSTVTTEIAKVVADAPEDFNTLKEMSDWISNHENDASAMNSAISDNKTAITALQTGKADKSEIPTTVAELTDSADYAKTADVNNSISTLQTDKADASDLTAHTDDADIHVTADNKATWNTVSDKVDKEDGKGLSTNDYTNEEKSLVATIEDKVDKTSIATALDDTVTDEQVYSAKAMNTELDGVVKKTDISTTIDSTSTDDTVPTNKAVYDSLIDKVDKTIILNTADEVNSFDRTYQSFVINSTVAAAVGLPHHPESTWFCIHLSRLKGFKYPSQIAFEYAGARKIMYRVADNGVWSAWRKIPNISVEDVPLTSVPLDSSKFSSGNLRYEVKNGVCYVYITTLNAKYTFTSYDLSSSPMPKPSIGLVTAPIVSDTNGANMGFFYVGESFNFIPRCHIFIASEYGYATFSYPVAES